MSKAVFSYKFISLIIAALLLIGYLVMNTVIRKSDTNRALPNTVSVTNFGGPYTLVNHLGEQVNEQNLINDYKLIYFGFTYCPAICPTELAKITSVLNTLDPEIADKIQPVFISVDPERDTPDIIKDYITLFHPRLIGYTGTVDQINTVKSAYKVYSAKVEDPNMSEYTVDHSSYIYFIGPNDQLISLYRIEDDVEKMVSDISNKIEN